MLNVKRLLTKLMTPKITTLTTNSLSHLSTVSVTLNTVGKVGILAIAGKNTNAALAVGSDASFSITDLPPLVVSSRGSGYSGSTCLVANVLPDGSVTMRATGSQWGASYDVYVAIPVILV